jgi:hypothetical protein
MKTYRNLLQTSIIIIIIGLNSYAIGNGIRLGSFWGILFSLGSLAALGYCIHLFRKLREIEAEEEQG